MTLTAFPLSFIAFTGVASLLLMILVVILVLVTILGIFYLHYTSKTKVRLALIEKRMDPRMADGDFFTRIIIILGGFALGLILGDLLPGRYGYGPLAGIILATVALIVYTILKRKKQLPRQ